MGAPIFFDNARYLSLLMRRLYGVLLIALAMTASLACFFAYKWYQASNLDNVYLLAPDQTLMATSTSAPLLPASSKKLLPTMSTIGRKT